MQKTLLKNISIIFGLLCCLFILWSRLLRTRKSVDLFTDYNIIRISIYFSLFIVSIILIIYFVCQVFEISSKRAFLKSLLEKPRVVSMIFFIQEYIRNAPKNLYEWLYLYIKIRPTIDRCCKFIQKYSIGDKPAIIRIIILSTTSFRVIVCMIFIYAVFHLNNLSYFYNSLPLLLIPVLFSIFLYSINHLATNNKKQLLLNFFYVFLYVICHMVLLLLIRFWSIGSYYSISSLNPFNMISMANFILLICFFCFIRIYILFSEYVWYKSVIRLYFYYCKIIYPYIHD